MANNNKVMKITAADFEKVVRNAVNQRMQIAGATGQGGSPGQLYKPPVTNPGRGEAVYGTEKDGQRYFEFLKAMMIDPANNIRKTGVPLGDNDDGYGENPTPGHPDWQLSKGPVLPEFKPMGREIKGVRKGVLSPEENKIKQQLQIGPQANMKDSLQRENVGGTLRDMMLPLLIKEYGKDGSGGYKNPGALLSGMKKLAKNLPANNIRRLQDSGHMTVPDPDGSGRLKIIDSLGPQAQVPANNIRSTGPLWRTRPKEGTNYREFYDPLTGMTRDDFKA